MKAPLCAISVSLCARTILRPKVAKENYKRQEENKACQVRGERIPSMTDKRSRLPQIKMDAIRAANATRAADAITEMIAGDTTPVVLTPWTEAVISPDPGQGTWANVLYHTLIHDPEDLTSTVTMSMSMMMMMMRPLQQYR